MFGQGLPTIPENERLNIYVFFFFVFFSFYIDDMSYEENEKVTLFTFEGYRNTNSTDSSYMTQYCIQHATAQRRHDAIIKALLRQNDNYVIIPSS